VVTKLSELEIDEVSLVDVPANNKRVIYKSNGEKMRKTCKESPCIEREELPLKDASTPAIAETAAEVREAAEEAGQAAEQAVTAAEAVEQVAEALMGAEEKAPEVKETEKEEAKYCEYCGKELVDHECPGCLDKRKKVSKAIVDLQKKIAVLETEARTAKNALITKEFVEKATSEFSHIPGVSSDQLGAILKNAFDTMNPENYKALLSVLKASESVLKQNILTQTISVRSDPRLTDGSASSRLHAKATEIMHSVQKSGEKITYEKAYMKAMQENPSLYQEYLSGR
jgi:hypothetical protein